MPSAFYKVVIEGKNNTVNTWVVTDREEIDIIALKITRMPLRVILFWVIAFCT
jgi:hypothetical protein